MTGRKPLRREQLDLKGTYQKCRHETRNTFDSDELPDVGDPPVHMSGPQRVIWRELVSESVPGVLRASDRIMVEISCGLLDQYRNGEPAAWQMQLLVKTLASLGFAPTERHRLGVKKPDEPTDEFELLN